VLTESDAIRWFDHARRRRVARNVKRGALAAYLLTLGGVGTVPLIGWAALVAGVAVGVGWLAEAGGPGSFTEGKSEPGELVLEGSGLVIRSGTRKESIRADQIDSGWLEEPDHLVLQLDDGRSVSARLPERRVRLQILSALGVSAADRVLSVPIYSRLGSVPAGELLAVLAGLIILPLAALAWSGLSITLWQTLAGALSGGAALVSLGGVAVVVVVATLLSWLLRAAFLSRRAVIGTDGIVIEGAWRTVIPFSEIDSVTRAPTGAEIHRKNGARVRLPTGRSDPLYPTPLGDEQATRAERLVSRATEAMAAAGGSRLLDQKAAWLESGGRGLMAWRRALELLGERTGDYRRPGITNDELLEIARDAARTREQRVAAMFLIGKRRTDTALAEASLAACADPKLSDLLRAALSGVLRDSAIGRGEPPPRLRVADVGAEYSSPSSGDVVDAKRSSGDVDDAEPVEPAERRARR
jgi:hypothetical protein